MEKKMNFSFVNRRKFIRAAVNMNVSYSVSKIRIRNKLEDDWVDCELYDISLSGLSLRVKQCLVKNELIKIKIIIDKNRYIYNAQIKNVNGQRVGVKYLDITDSNKRSINTIINNELKNKQKARNLNNTLRVSSLLISKLKKPRKMSGSLIAI
jgi:c-di-GMP-binding flagellar brake protein YcgR